MVYIKGADTLPRCPGIYRILTPDGNYVGQSINLRDRLKWHVENLENGVHHNRNLARVAQVHPTELFAEALEVILPDLEGSHKELWLLRREGYWLRQEKRALNIAETEFPLDYDQMETEIAMLRSRINQVNEEISSLSAKHEDPPDQKVLEYLEKESGHWNSLRWIVTLFIIMLTIFVPDAWISLPIIILIWRTRTRGEKKAKSNWERETERGERCRARASELVELQSLKDFHCRRFYETQRFFDAVWASMAKKQAHDALRGNVELSDNVLEYHLRSFTESFSHHRTRKILDSLIANAVTKGHVPSCQILTAICSMKSDSSLHRWLSSRAPIKNSLVWIYFAKNLNASCNERWQSAAVKDRLSSLVEIIESEFLILSYGKMYCENALSDLAELVVLDDPCALEYLLLVSSFDNSDHIDLTNERIDLIEQAKLGEIEAQYRMGVIHDLNCAENADNKTKECIFYSWKRAVYWYTMAAKQGHQESTLNLDYWLKIFPHRKQSGSKRPSR